MRRALERPDLGEATLSSPEASQSAHGPSKPRMQPLVPVSPKDDFGRNGEGSDFVVIDLNNMQPLGNGAADAVPDVVPDYELDEGRAYVPAPAKNGLFIDTFSGDFRQTVHKTRQKSRGFAQEQAV